MAGSESSAPILERPPVGRSTRATPEAGRWYLSLSRNGPIAATAASTSQAMTARCAEWS